MLCVCLKGFPDSSVGKESTFNLGDTSSISVFGRSTGEGVGYPLQYSWASLLAQLVKNPPAMWEIWVPFLGWEDPLEKGKATHSSILIWRISPWGHKESDTTDQLSLVCLKFIFMSIYLCICEQVKEDWKKGRRKEERKWKQDWSNIFFQGSEVKVAQSCLILCDPLYHNLPGSSVHGILQARILEWVAISFSRGSSQPRDQTQVSHIAGGFFIIWPTRGAG